MEPVFKALSDSNRRLLLDKLHERDGQTLLELQRHLPEMTRFGTMKHLKVLEEAGLVITRRSGREKHHFLNRVPIQLLYDRWVVKYARPWTRSLTGLKGFLEGTAMPGAGGHVFEVYIRTTEVRLWQALTDGDQTRRYFQGWTVESAWEQGSVYRFLDSDGNVVIDGAILEIDSPRKLVVSIRGDSDVESEPVETSTVRFVIELSGKNCKLTVVYQDHDSSNAMAEEAPFRWPLILSGLKTWLETGEPLDAGGIENRTH